MKYIPGFIKVTITVLCCAIALFFIVGYRNEIAWQFEKQFADTANLDFDNNISVVVIWGFAFEEDCRVENPKEIDKLLNMLNSLEVVKRKTRPSPDASGPEPYTYISFGGNTVLLAEHYIYIFDTKLPDKFHEIYYVRNMEYEFQDERNEIAQYLKSLA